MNMKSYNLAIYESNTMRFLLYFVCSENYSFIFIGNNNKKIRKVK